MIEADSAAAESNAILSFAEHAPQPNSIAIRELSVRTRKNGHYASEIRLFNTRVLLLGSRKKMNRLCAQNRSPVPTHEWIMVPVRLDHRDTDASRLRITAEPLQ